MALDFILGSTEEYRTEPRTAWREVVPGISSGIMKGEWILEIKKTLRIIILTLMLFAIPGCADGSNNSPVSTDITATIIPSQIAEVQEISPTTTLSEGLIPDEMPAIFEYKGKPYEVIEVDGGDMSGERLSNVAVDVGYGDRVYIALTNDYDQLVYVIADEIILQDDDTEPVNSDGRYYGDEANVPGTEREDLDQGHVIADSLGGVSNAYNITPQDSTLNRHGDQAYMEKVIRDAGGCTDFIATITYADKETQIPSHYHYEYAINGEKVIDDFDNVNPDEVNAALITETPAPDKDTFDEKAELKNIDTNGNGKVTIAEAKAAGYSMPIYSDDWLYKYMDDRDHDGMVGE